MPTQLEILAAKAAEARALAGYFEWLESKGFENVDLDQLSAVAGPDVATLAAFLEVDPVALAAEVVAVKIDAAVDDVIIDDPVEEKV